MKFGKLPDISSVDFKLPANDASSMHILQETQNATSKPQAYIGCTGWSMKEWIGKVYPKGAKAANFLTHYGKQFNTIELNTTHYRIPTPDTITKWRNGVPQDFRFCPKIPQTISHSRDLGLSSGLIPIFCEAVRGLEKQLGCCFMQLPPYIGFNFMDILKHFFEIFPSHIPLAVEIRQEDWFSNEKHFESFFQLLERFRISSVITDVAGRRDVLHQRLTTSTAMVRFVGNGLHPSDYTRIDAWVERLQVWLENGLQQVFFFTHEPDNILAPELAAYMVQQLQKHSDFEVRGPRFVPNNEQLSLF